MMQEYIRHHGRNYPALRRALVRVRERSRLQHTGVPPLADPSQDSSILDPLRATLPQVAPVAMVETSTDIRIDSPVAVQLPALFAPVVQRLMGTVALPEAVGTCMKVLSKDGLSDHHHRPLDHLVLEAGRPYWPLLPPFFLDPYPLDWRGDRPIVAPPLMQVPEGVVQVRLLPTGTRECRFSMASSHPDSWKGPDDLEAMMKIDTP